MALRVEANDTLDHLQSGGREVTDSILAFCRTCLEEALRSSIPWGECSSVVTLKRFSYGTRTIVQGTGWLFLRTRSCRTPLLSAKRFPFVLLGLEVMETEVAPRDPFSRPYFISFWHFECYIITILHIMVF